MTKEDDPVDHLKDFDSVEYLKDEEAIAMYLRYTPEEGEPDEEFQAQCLTNAIRARAINQLAATTGIDRKLVYEIISGYRHDSATITKLQAAFAAVPKSSAKELAQV